MSEEGKLDVNDYLNSIRNRMGTLLSVLSEHKYSPKSLYIAQECLIDMLLSVHRALILYKGRAKSFRYIASEKALSLKEKGAMTEREKTQLSRLYEKAAGSDETSVELRKFRWLLRCIGDGIAWHAYGFNRRAIKSLGTKEPVNFPSDPDTFPLVRNFFRAYRSTDRKYLPLMHDLTNCLRTGDFSIFYDGVLKDIFDLKITFGQHEKKGPEGRVKRQVDRFKKIGKYYETNKLEELYPDLKGGFYYGSKVREEHNFTVLTELLGETKKNGYASARPEASVLYMAYMTGAYSPEESLQLAMQENRDFFKSRGTHGLIRPNEKRHLAMPVTAMPFGAEDILSIMFSDMAVVTFLNFDELVAASVNAGIPFRAKFGSGKEFHFEIDGKPGGLVGPGLMERLMNEGLSVQSFLDLIRDLLDNSLETISAET